MIVDCSCMSDFLSENHLYANTVLKNHTVAHGLLRNQTENHILVCFTGFSIARDDIICEKRAHTTKARDHYRPENPLFNEIIHTLRI